MAVERKLMTAEELLALPDDGMRHELIDGELRTMAPAGGPHGGEIYRVTMGLGRHIDDNALGDGFGAETGFLLRRDPDRVRAPGFAFIRADRLPPDGVPEGWVTIAPDLVVEVVSSGDSAAEVREKVADWLAFGSRAVWVLYPGPRLDIHLPDGTSRTYAPADEIDGAPALPAFRLPPARPPRPHPPHALGPHHLADVHQ